MQIDPKKTKEAIAVVAGMKEVYKTLVYADEALTSLGSLEAKKKWLEPVVAKLQKEKAVAEEELAGVNRQTEKAKSDLKRNVDEQAGRMKGWLAQEKKKAEVEVAKHRADLLAKLSNVERAILSKEKALKELDYSIEHANKSLAESEKKKEQVDKSYAELSAKLEGLKAEMRKLGGVA
ncbi:MAG: hypothetical protein ACYSP9_04525 [Planctomycetota bacterium]|jgi:chromosome segregation ATPase